MSPEQRAFKEREIEQIDAIFALEGFVKTNTARTTQAAVLAGLGTYEEAIEEMTAYAHKHKTTEGFVYSKAVDLPVAKG